MSLLLGAASLLAPQPAQAVANGVPAPEGTLTFAAKFTFTGVPAADGSTYDSACSGALVAPDQVLTAGHCFHDAARAPVSGPPGYASSTVTVGTTDATDPDAEVRTVVEVQQAPNGSDVALARLSAPVETVEPLPLAGHAPQVGEVLVLAGWGATATDPAPSDRLMTGLVEVSSVGDQIVGVTGHAPAADTGACAYDSGAPYVELTRRGPRLVSVESGGPPCPHTDEERTSRVDVLAPWIESRSTGPSADPDHSWPGPDGRSPGH